MEIWSHLKAMIQRSGAPSSYEGVQSGPTHSQLPPSQQGADGAIGAVEITGLEDYKGSRNLSVALHLLLDAHVSTLGELRHEGSFRYSVVSGQISFEYARAKFERIADKIHEQLKTITGLDQGLKVDVLAAPGAPSCQIVRSARVQELFDQLKARRLKASEIWAGKLRAVRKTATAVFYPLWCPETQSTPLSWCELDLTLRKTLLEDVQASGTHAQLREIYAHYEIMALQKALLAVYHLQGQRCCPTVVVSASHHTVLKPGLLSRYIEQIDSAPAGLGHNLIVEVNCPYSADTAERIRHFAQKLRGSGAKLLLHLDPSRVIGDHSATIPAWGVSTRFSEARHINAETARWVTSFVRHADELGRSTLANALDTVALAAQCAQTGVNFLGGAAVHHPLCEPRLSVRYRPILPHNAGFPWS